MNRTETEFVIYMIHDVANRYNVYPSEVYKAMNKTGCINDYLVPFYDVLHTLNSENVANDIVEYIKGKGIVL